MNFPVVEVVSDAKAQILDWIELAVDAKQVLVEGVALAALV